MKLSIKKGFSFGLTSGIITTLGMIVGLGFGTHSRAIVISGILVIAIADALSDALGVHVSEEAENVHSAKEIWESTIATFASKFFFALTFVVPFLLFSINPAMIICVVWGLAFIIGFSVYLARLQKTKLIPVIFEHLLITIVVLIATYFVGQLVDRFFL